MNGSKQIIIASLPENFYIPDISGTAFYGKREAAYYNFTSIGDGLPAYYLKPEFVMGMYDSETRDFIDNEKYYENLPEEEQAKLFDEVKNGWINVIKESGWTFSEYAEFAEECNFPNPLSKKEIQELDKKLFDEKALKDDLDFFTENSKISGINETVRSIEDDAKDVELEEKEEDWAIDEW